LKKIQIGEKSSRKIKFALALRPMKRKSSAIS
jgi:hypothetical protein